jgi:hypothetical protein
MLALRAAVDALGREQQRMVEQLEGMVEQQRQHQQHTERMTEQLEGMRIAFTELAEAAAPGESCWSMRVCTQGEGTAGRGVCA